jgi:hypothetical protein
MADDKMQLQRWELKYVVPEELALAVREFVRPYLELDEYGAKRADLSYTIHNLYLDSENLAIYWGTINGDKNRYKLRLRFYEDNVHAPRLRYYDDRPQTPVFFEIKRRMNEAILKQRSGIKRGSVEAVLAGQLPAPSELVSSDPRQLVAIQRFVELMMHDRAVPVAHVRYDREAWISVMDNSVRVTMDRNVLIAPEFVARFSEQMDDPTCVFGKLVILELKFTGRFPDWFKELVRVFGLRQGSASKYADGIARKGEHFFHPRSVAPLPVANAAAAEGRRDARLSRLDNLLSRAA